MNKIVCLYWVPGSGGDMIQHVLSKSGNFSNMASGGIDANGRAPNKTDSRLLDLFPSAGIGWYNRVWTVQDIQQLIQLSDSSSKPWIIGTHRREQVESIKQHAPTTTIGITYFSSLYPAVIKNWCKKAASTSVENQQQYSKTHPVASRKFKEKGLYPEFMLTEILNHIDNVPKTVPPEFDINISLGDLYNGDLDSIEQFINVDSKLVFDQWLDLQDPLYKFCFDHSEAYVDIIGYNTLSTVESTSPIVLSSLDQILISHYCKRHNLIRPKTLKTQIDLLNFIDTVIR
jgi:hypothetical protein